MMRRETTIIITIITVAGLLLAGYVASRMLSGNGGVIPGTEHPHSSTTNSASSSEPSASTPAERTITRGLVLIDGRYLPLPYGVTRNGTYIYVNGILVEKGPLETTALDDSVDPPVPAGWTKEMSMYDKVFKEYIRRKVAYVSKHHTREEERQIMESVYRSLPFVRDTRLDANNPNLLQITTFSGESHNISLVSLRREMKSQAELEREASSRKENYQLRLAKGDVFLFFSNRGHTTFNEARGKMVLPRMDEILRADWSAEQKVEKLQKIDLVMFDKDNVSLWAKELRNSTAWNLCIQQVDTSSTQPKTQ